ncbi:LamG domain-containing protein, partial [Candidatus Woesearchaeota archaeon]|nr:LamG domain-containing protein [Candidatus Woesearchaeota archaeon]
MINFNNISALGENNTHVVDLSKYENNGTSEGDASPTISGKYDGGWTFDGSGDSIDVGSGSSVDFGGETDITIALWANVSQSTSDDNKYIFKGNQFDFQVQNSLNNRIRFEVNNGSWQSCITGNNVAEIGTWAHYTATYNGSEAKIYKNAELVKSCTITGSFNADGDSQSLCISTTTSCGGQDAEINGSIDELMIWNTTLNAQEIYQLYASNFHKYDSDSWELYVNQSYNATNSLPDGNYTFYSFTTNSSGTENTTATRIISVDTTLPEISIIYPSNNTNYSDNGLDINYTAVDTNLDSCWYTNGTGSANATLSNCANITNVTWPENTYNITIWANDSAGNLDNSNVTFTIDYTSPQWQNNETNLTPVIMLGTSIYFNITLNDSRPSHYIFSFYNGSTWINDSAVSYSNGEEIYVVKNTSIASGYINWTWYINDTAGNLNQTNMFNAVMTATDTDEDGVIDLSDPLFYNESNVSSSGITRLNITVGGNATNETFSDLQEVKFYDSSNLLMNFSHNFSETNLDLSNITVNLDSTWMLINLSGQVQAEYNKTIYITDNSFASLCVKDAEISSISNISVECNQANETDFTSCLGGSLTDNGITCEDQGTIIKISN